MTTEQMKIYIKRQKNIILATGIKPTWKVFSSTFGWYKMKHRLLKEEQKQYEQIWKEVTISPCKDDCVSCRTFGCLLPDVLKP